MTVRLHTDKMFKNPEVNRDNLAVVQSLQKEVNIASSDVFFYYFGFALYFDPGEQKTSFDFWLYLQMGKGYASLWMETYSTSTLLKTLPFTQCFG